MKKSASHLVGRGSSRWNCRDCNGMWLIKPGQKRNASGTWSFVFCVLIGCLKTVLDCSNCRELAKPASSLRYLLLSVLCSNAVNLYSKNKCKLWFVIHMVCAGRFPQSCFPFLASPKLQAIAEKTETPQALGRWCSVCWYVAWKLFWTGEGSLCFRAVWCCALTAGNWRNQQAAWGTCSCLCCV